MSQAELFTQRSPTQELRIEHMAKVRATVRGSERAICPVCGKLDKMYRRKLGKHQAKAALWLQRHGGWCHVQRKGPKFMVQDPCWVWLKYWSLIEAQPNDDPSKSDSGLWRLTAKGDSFASGLIALPSHALVYHDEVERYEGDFLTINELVDVFHYRRLMDGEW
jgi:hypothetical protein